VSFAVAVGLQRNGVSVLPGMFLIFAFLAAFLAIIFRVHVKFRFLFAPFSSTEQATGLHILSQY
jgi:hypothetical protein